MSVSLYALTIENYLQALSGVKTILDKGAEYAASRGENPDDLVGLRLCEDMAPVHFQVISVWHHSLGAVNGMRAGLFQPPPKTPDFDYAGLQELVNDTLATLREITPEEINPLADKPMVFRAGEREIPFTMANFALSFSLPNLYFHATTLYDLLRQHGVPLSKMTYLGALRVG